MGAVFCRNVVEAVVRWQRRIRRSYRSDGMTSAAVCDGLIRNSFSEDV